MTLKWFWVFEFVIELYFLGSNVWYNFKFITLTGKTSFSMVFIIFVILELIYFILYYFVPVKKIKKDRDAKKKTKYVFKLILVPLKTLMSAYSIYHIRRFHTMSYWQTIYMCVTWTATIIVNFISIILTFVLLSRAGKKKKKEEDLELEEVE